VDVAGQFHHVCIAFHHHSLESPLEKVPASPQPVFEPARISQAQPLHGPGKVCRVGAQQQMEVVPHQNKGEDIHLEAIRCLPKGAKEQLPVSIIKENVLRFIAVGGKEKDTKNGIDGFDLSFLISGSPPQR
jgi:hypothetical protein